MEKTIGIYNKETTTAGTLILTMNPVNNAKWISTPELITAEIAVQPYGVFSIPNYEDLGETELIAYVTIDYVTYQAALADLIAAEIGAEITFTASGTGGGGANDAEITKKIQGQPYSLYDSAASYIGEKAFAGDSKLTEITVPNASEVGTGAFSAIFTGFIKASLNTVTSVQNYGFASCRELQEVYAPSLQYVGSYAFCSCYALSIIDFTNVIRVLSGAFSWCSSLSEVVAPNMTSINQTAFMGCIGLKKVDMPKLEAVSAQAFQGCTSLTDVSLPSVTTVGSNAFNGTAVMELNLPKVRVVSGSAFKDCASLETITLGSMSSFAASPFSGCIMLKSLYIKASTSMLAPYIQTTTFDTSPFTNSSYLGYYASIYVPESQYSTFQASTAWSSYMDRIVSI